MQCQFENCGEPELTQARCYDHCRLCPVCKHEPCNGDVKEPMCDTCLQRFVDSWSGDDSCMMTGPTKC